MKRSLKNKNSKTINQLEEWLKLPIIDVKGVRHSKAKGYKVWKLTQYSSKPGDPPKEIRKELVIEFPNDKEVKEPINKRKKYNSKSKRSIKKKSPLKKANSRNR